jgi:hypothetical protein
VPTVRLIIRFLAKVDRRGLDECWPWTGSTNEQGYGSIRRSGERGPLLKAHRVAYEIAHPDEPPLTADDHVCHHCDNPPCCNPSHLYRGNYQTNTADKMRRQRQSAGISHSAAIQLAWERRGAGERHAAAARMADAGATLRQIAAALGYAGKSAAGDAVTAGRLKRIS